jgi:Flp pilus assembly protein TadG
MSPRAATRRAALLARLRADRKGAAAVIFALSLPVLLGAGALAIDTSLNYFVKNRLQSAADAAALAGLRAIDNRPTVVPAAIQYANLNVPANFGEVTKATDVELGVYNGDTKTFTVDASLDVNAVRVTTIRSKARGNAVPRLLSAIYLTENTDVRAVAIAARQQKVQYEPPERVNLANEAYDYNEIYAYCFKYSGTGTPASRRSQMTLVSNNMAPGQKITVISKGYIKQEPPGDTLVWPKCEKGESLSFRLMNIRDAKNNPKLFEKPASLKIFNHYTDTYYEDGVEKFALTNNILETVRCDTLDKCDPSKPGSSVPTGKNRTPKVEQTPCLPGKFMYYGWEDRPPAEGSDRDYDDIVMVMKCPVTGILGDGLTRLVR